MKIIAVPRFRRLWPGFACFVFWLAGAAHVGAATPRRIIILHGTNPLRPASVFVERMIRETVSSTAALYPVEFQSEVFDPAGLPSSEYESALITLLKQKYSDRKPDIVLAIQAPAFEFVLRQRARLWPDAAVVFFGIPEGAVAERSLPAGVTGITGQVDVAGTVKFAFALQPDARHAVIVGGVADTDRQWVPLVKSALRAYEKRVTVNYLTDHSLPEIIETVKTLPKDTIVLYTSMFQDAAGRTTVPSDLVAQLVYCP